MTTINKSLAIAKLKDLIILDGHRVHNNAISHCINILRDMEDTVENVTLEVGDTIYVDSNETFTVDLSNNIYKLFDLSGQLVDTFNDINHIVPTLNGQYNKVEVIKHNIITDEYEYIDYFDDTIYLALVNIGKAKGLKIDSNLLTNEMLGELRNHIVDYLTKNTDNQLDLLPPDREYNLGDKVTVYHGGSILNATIIWIASEEKYGLLLDGEFVVEYSTGIVDTPTSYIHYLVHDYGVTIE